MSFRECSQLQAYTDTSRENVSPVRLGKTQGEERTGKRHHRRRDESALPLNISFLIVGC